MSQLGAPSSRGGDALGRAVGPRARDRHRHEPIGIAEQDLVVADLNPQWRKPGQVHFGRHAFVNPGQLVFVDIHIHPHGGQVGNLILVLAGLDIMTFQGFLLGDHTGSR